MIRFLLLISLLIFFSCEDTNTSSSEIELEEDCAGILGGENICGCMDSTAINYDSTATYDDGSCLNTINIIYNVHESLPADWITEFYIIMNNLQNIIPKDGPVIEEVKKYLNKYFMDKHEINVQTIVQGTGQAIRTAQDGNVELLLVHLQI